MLFPQTTGGKAYPQSTHLHDSRGVRKQITSICRRKALVAVNDVNLE